MKRRLSDGRVNRAKYDTPNLCTLCSAISVPGLLRGAGKCQYHWVAGVWGKEYADRLVAEGVILKPKGVK